MSPAAPTPGAKQVSVSLAEFRTMAEDQIRRADAAKAEGGVAFASGDLDAARARYDDAIVLLDALTSLDACRRPDFRGVLRRAECLAMHLHANLAACALKSGAFEEAASEAQQALALDGDNAKATYRLGRALHGLARYGDAAKALERACALSPGDAAARRALADVRRDAREAAAGARHAFGGMFDAPAYARDVGRAERQADATTRQHLASKLTHAIRTAREASLLERWVQSGLAACGGGGGEGEIAADTQTLTALARRAAAAGHLDAADDRSALAAHGIGIAKAESGAASESNMNKASPQHSEEREREREREKDAAELMRVRLLTQQLRDGASLSADDADFLAGFRKAEAARLRAQLSSEGLSQTEMCLLEKLDAQNAHYDHATERAEARAGEIAAAVAAVSSGRRVPLRERLRMWTLLEEERIRLEAKDDADEGGGLDSQEWHLLQVRTKPPSPSPNFLSLLSLLSLLFLSSPLFIDRMPAYAGANLQWGFYLSFFLHLLVQRIQRMQAQRSEDEARRAKARDQRRDLAARAQAK